MSRWKIHLAFVATLYSLPYIALMGLGGWWLFERGYATLFAVAAAVLSLLGWLIDRLIRARSHAKFHRSVETLGATGEAAVRIQIEALASKAEENPPSPDDFEAWKRLLLELFNTVAVGFDRKSDQPGLEVTVPEAMLIGECVLRDLRNAAKENIPGSHLLTIRQFEQMLKIWTSTQAITANDSVWRMGYRLVRFALNPVSGVFQEAQDGLLQQLSGKAIQKAHSWGAGYCVRQAGEYAIQLYSGQLAFNDPTFDKFRSPKSKEDIAKANRTETRRAEDPLRVIVLGQTKSGKSSLINAIFGLPLAATDSLPCTVGVTPYVLDRDGLQKMILFDTEGFGGSDDRRASETLEGELAKCDLVVMVCSAATAARAADQQLLNELRQHFIANKRRAIPPIVVVLSQIDKLRPFGEWKPPYDLRDGSSTKARNISAAVETLAIDLSLRAELIVPVCLQKDAIYNVTETLIPVILEILPDAERTKLLRLLREHHDWEYWSQLRRQAYNLGRLLKNAVLSKNPDVQVRTRSPD